MGTTALRQLLKSLCSNSTWKYAVLWKLRHGSPMILTWEDGYCDYPKPRQPVESISNHTYCSRASDMVHSQFERSTSDNSSGGYPIGLVVADLSRLQYAFGEGVVGQVAVTGNHCWVSFNNIFCEETKPKLVPQCPEEWLLQFASGIKTILLVPVLPLGVLQLGSLKEVAEDIEVVAHLKGRFNGFFSVGGNAVPFTLKRHVEVETESSSSLISSSTNYMHAPSAGRISPVKSENSDHSVVCSVKIDEDNLSTLNQVLPLVTEQDVYGLPGKNLPEAFKYDSENKIETFPIVLTEESSLTESLNACQMELVESKLFELTSLMEELHAYSECTDYNWGVFGESFNSIMSVGREGNNEDQKDVSSFLNFPKDSELHKALGPAFHEHTNEKSRNSYSFVEDTASSPSFIRNSLSDRTGPSWLARDGDSGYLLEAVVANASNISDTCIRPYNFKSLPNSSTHFVASSQPQMQSKASVLVDDSVPSSHITSVFTTGHGYSNANSAASKSILSSNFDEEIHKEGTNHIQSRKGQKMSNVSKRRAKHGNNQRQRPRDRQLIQDRVKELRELVPNGSKCSIDGLLDRTIKHMMYLRSVTNQAEKLSQWALEEVNTCKSRRSSETTNYFQDGASWALEFGAEPQICPIVVEDLAHPGHMLIEMLCDEHGLFLEIAQVIRGLELAILKGVMESRSNNTWAHFIVEVSKGFHRLDIFWPLMQLLQRKRKPISSKI